MVNTPKEFTILVVEDELPLQTAIRTKLEGLGLIVVTARTIQQAFDYLQEVKNIDAIWLDHYLIGKGSGLDFVAQLREDNYPKLPIFVVSNSIDQEKITSYLRLGVNKYYTKTECRLLDIVNDIRDYLNREVPQRD